MKELTLKDLDNGVIVVMPSGFKYKVHRVQCQLTHGEHFAWSRELEIGLKGYSYFEPTAQPKSEEENIMKKEFTKADLKSGMKVVLRNRDCYTVFLNTEKFGDVIVNDTTDPYNSTWSTLSRYKESLEADQVAAYDIMGVYTSHVYNMTANGIDRFELLWKREEKTQEQIAYEALQAQIAEEEERHKVSMQALKDEAEKLLKAKG